MLYEGLVIITNVEAIYFGLITLVSSCKSGWKIFFFLQSIFLGVHRLPVICRSRPTANVENVNIRQTTAQPPAGDYKGTGVLRWTNFHRLAGRLIQMCQTRNLHNHGLTKRFDFSETTSESFLRGRLIFEVHVSSVWFLNVHYKFKRSKLKDWQASRVQTALFNGIESTEMVVKDMI